MHLKGSGNISAVILDYGQVLVRCPTPEEFGRMAEMFNVRFELFFELWEASRGPYDRGDLTAEEYWLQLGSSDEFFDRQQADRNPTRSGG